jgi:regulator of protease activity HflC (stomatin/prohibitin superfamily)
MSTLTSKIEILVIEEMRALEGRIAAQDTQISNQKAVINEHRALQQQLRAELFEQKKANAEMASFVKMILQGAQTTSRVIQHAENAEVKRIGEQLIEQPANGKQAKRPSLRERLHLGLPPEAEVAS